MPSVINAPGMPFVRSRALPRTTSHVCTLMKRRRCRYGCALERRLRSCVIALVCRRRVMAHSRANRHQPPRPHSIGASTRRSAQSLVQDVGAGGRRAMYGRRATYGRGARRAGCGILVGQAQRVVFPPPHAHAACLHAHSNFVASLRAFVRVSRYGIASGLWNGRDAEEEEALEQALRASQLESESADEVCTVFSL